MKGKKIFLVTLLNSILYAPETLLAIGKQAGMQNSL